MSPEEQLLRWMQLQDVFQQRSNLAELAVCRSEQELAAARLSLEQLTESFLALQSKQPEVCPRQTLNTASMALWQGWREQVGLLQQRLTAALTAQQQARHSWQQATQQAEQARKLVSQLQAVIDTTTARAEQLELDELALIHAYREAATS